MSPRLSDKRALQLIRQMNGPRREKFRRRWAARRAGGKFRYVLFFGIVVWGIPLAVIQIVLSHALQAATHRSSFLPGLQKLFTTVEGLEHLVLHLFLFSLFGYGWGVWLWHQ